MSFYRKYQGGAPVGSVLEEVEKTRRMLKRQSGSVLDPNGDYMARWDMITTFFLLFTAIVTPVEVGFTRQLGGNPRQWAIWWINRIVDLVFIKDIGVQFFVPYVDETRGSLVIRSRRLIARHYLRGWFWIDTVSVIPFDLLDGLSKLKIMRLIKLLKLLKLGRVLKANRTLARWESSIAISYAKISMYTFALGIVFVAHWMACGWALIDTMSDAEAWTWVKHLELVKESPIDGTRGFRPESMLHRYCASLYFSIYTLTSIGYGDIAAVNLGEFILSSFFMLLGSFFWAYTIGSFCATLATMDMYEVQWKQTMDEMNAMMKDRHFQPALRRKVRMFVKNAKHLQKAANYRGLEQQMSLALRGVAAKANHRGWLARTWYFSPPYVETVNEGFVAEMSQSLLHQLFAPLEAYEIAKSLCILESGIVARDGRPVSKGAVWGLDFVLRDDVGLAVPLELASVNMGSSLTYAEIMSLHQDSLYDILDGGHYPEVEDAIRLAVLFYRMQRAMKRLVMTVNKSRLEGRATAHDELFKLARESMQAPRKTPRQMRLEGEPSPQRAKADLAPLKGEKKRLDNGAARSGREAHPDARAGAAGLEPDDAGAPGLGDLGAAILAPPPAEPEPEAELRRRPTSRRQRLRPSAAPAPATLRRRPLAARPESPAKAASFDAPRPESEPESPNKEPRGGSFDRAKKPRTAKVNLDDLATLIRGAVAAEMDARLGADRGPSPSAVAARRPPVARAEARGPRPADDGVPPAHDPGDRFHTTAAHVSGASAGGAGGASRGVRGDAPPAMGFSPAKKDTDGREARARRRVSGELGDPVRGDPSSGAAARTTSAARPSTSPRAAASRPARKAA
ncbi:voltage-gated potassium channel [Aureococcus anophagefferens]|nr:voltage-gated potassium channel [Aureococcus anophagefferens]